MNHSMHEIKDKINRIICQNFGINILEKNYENENFFGNKIHLHARHLIFILFYVENIFNIKLTEKQLLTKKIYTLNTLSETIIEVLDKERRENNESFKQ